MLSSHLKSICFLAFQGYLTDTFQCLWGCCMSLALRCWSEKTWTSNGPNTLWLCGRIGRFLTHFEETLTHFEETFDSFPSSETSTIPIIPGFKPPKIRNDASFSPPALGSRSGVFSQHPVLQQAVSWNVVSSGSMLLNLLNIPNNRRKIGWMLLYHWVLPKNRSLQFLAKHSPCLAHRTRNLRSSFSACDQPMLA